MNYGDFSISSTFILPELDAIIINSDLWVAFHRVTSSSCLLDDTRSPLHLQSEWGSHGLPHVMRSPPRIFVTNALPFLCLLNVHTTPRCQILARVIILEHHSLSRNKDTRVLCLILITSGAVLLGRRCIQQPFKTPDWRP